MSNTKEKQLVKFAEIISGGRVTIPNEQRTQLGLIEGDPVRVWIEDGQILIKKVET